MGYTVFTQIPKCGIDAKIIPYFATVGHFSVLEFYLFPRLKEYFPTLPVTRRFIHWSAFANWRMCAVTCATALAGCAPKPDNQIRVDHVPPGVETTPLMGVNTADGNNTGGPSMAGPAAGMAALPGMAEFTAATPTPKWNPPATWATVPLTTARKGSWRAPADAPADQQVEISVTVFQGSLGGLLANVNRWRGKVGLPGDVTDANLADNVQNITLDGRAAQLVSVDGPQGESLDGVLVILPDRVWSLLLSGSTDVVKAQRPAFRAFLDSIQWQDQ
jgi:hypothetical protein